MKKLVFAFAAMVAVSFAACNNGNKTETTVVDTESIEEVDTTGADTTVVDTTVVDTVAVVAE